MYHSISIDKRLPAAMSTRHICNVCAQRLYNISNEFILGTTMMITFFLELYRVSC
jgi:hypothetical protein